jgi:hypothetical protein
MSRSSSEGLPRPEEFPVGSAESRAAARALLQSREKGIRGVQVIILNMSHRPPRESGDDTKGAVGPWYEGKDGSLIRTVCLPRGADEETKRRLLATP